MLSSYDGARALCGPLVSHYDTEPWEPESLIRKYLSSVQKLEASIIQSNQSYSSTEHCILNPEN